MEILFTSKFVGRGFAQIFSNLRWFGKDQPLITKMTNDHIRNARVWLYSKIMGLSTLGYPQPINNGFDYDQWLVILADEELRRQTVEEQKQLDHIKELKIEAMSIATRKTKARKLLDSPTPENIEAAEKLLKVTKKQNNLGYSIQNYAVYGTFDHSWDAHESQCMHNGW